MISYDIHSTWQRLRGKFIVEPSLGPTGGLSVEAHRYRALAILRAAANPEPHTMVAMEYD